MWRYGAAHLLAGGLVLLFGFANLLADVTLAWLDPRVREASA